MLCVIYAAAGLGLQQASNSARCEGCSWAALLAALGAHQQSSGSMLQRLHKGLLQCTLQSAVCHYYAYATKECMCL